MRSPRSRSSINLYQRETVLCSWLGPRPVLSPQRARGHPSGSEREDEEAARPSSSVLGKHGPQSPASASAQQRAKKVKPAARKKAQDEKKEKNAKKKKNTSKLREKSREKSPEKSSSPSGSES